MGRQAHVLMIPVTAQGHVAPLIKLAHRISDHGIIVTFVNTDFIHEKVVAALPEEAAARSRIRLVSIPDGLDSGDDRKDFNKLTESFDRVMPGHLKGLIEKLNSSSDEDKQITCVISDIALERRPIGVAEKIVGAVLSFCTSKLGFGTSHSEAN